MSYKAVRAWCVPLMLLGVTSVAVADDDPRARALGAC